MKRIKRPDFLFKNCCECEVTPYTPLFERWFNAHIEPLNAMLEGAVEVRRSETSRWLLEDSWDLIPEQSYKAYLIGIEPIKKQTREERLEEFYQDIIELRHKHLTRQEIEDELFYLQDKAKQALKEGE